MKKEKQKGTQECTDMYNISPEGSEIWERPVKPFSELNLMDDFMFEIATEDIETCKDIVELSLNIRIREIRRKQGQKPIRNVPGKRGIRLDFYVIDENGKVYFSSIP